MSHCSSIGHFAFLTIVATSIAVLAGAAPPGGGSTPPPDPAIVFADSGIKVMNADGTNVRTLVSLRRGESARVPAWSPDGTEVAYWGIRGGTAGIWIVSVSGGSPRLLVQTADTQFPPLIDWSPTPAPDGENKIVFSDNSVMTPAGLDRDIFMINPDGTGLANLTQTGSAFTRETAAAWTSDAEYLVIKRERDIVVLDVEMVGGEMAVVSETVVYTVQPFHTVTSSLRCANASDQAVLAIDVNGVQRIVTLDLADPFANPVLLTSGSSADESMASFSPSDTRLSFHRGGRSGGIFAINADGTGETRISSRGSDPCWRRTP